MNGNDITSMVSSLFNRNAVEDPRITTNCDGTKTLTISEDEADGTVDTTKYIFPGGYFDGNDDGNSTPFVEHSKSSNAMLLEYSRKPITESMFAIA